MRETVVGLLGVLTRDPISFFCGMIACAVIMVVVSAVVAGGRADDSSERVVRDLAARAEKNRQATREHSVRESQTATPLFPDDRHFSELPEDERDRRRRVVAREIIRELE